MSKLVYSDKKGIITVTNKLSYPENVNEQIVGLLSVGMFKGLLPISVERNREDISIECNIIGLVPLSRFLSDMIDRRTFMSLLESITEILRYCERNGLATNNIEFRKDSVFVDPGNNTVKCIYWPVVNNQRAVSPAEFLRSLTFGILFNPSESLDYVETYKAFFDSLAPFSVSNFERMINGLTGRSAVQMPNPFNGNFNNSGIGNMAYPGENARPQASNVAYDPFAAASAMPVPPAVSSYPDEPDNTGNTTILDDVVYKPSMPVNTVKGPSLMRVRTGDVVSINKNRFVIGKGTEQCDFPVTTNLYMSRVHAEIDYIDGHFYIVDLRSTNKTFLEGVQLMPENRYELSPGAHFRLADEDFIFNIS